ncbi:fimbrial protein [Pseudocitrobacter cyperus]|uniref:Fimbrial protein n=1 Tax=Pseudocitrobacter cyperus TaxID=3112843 RepID=A0ABV0HIX1_9ENTR
MLSRHQYRNPPGEFRRRIQKPTLLANTLTTDSAASGVGIEIQGKSTSISKQMVIVPNDASSVYRDYQPEIDTTNGIYGKGGTGVPLARTLHFQATMMRDGTSVISPGDFKATAIFSVTYP